LGRGTAYYSWLGDAGAGGVGEVEVASRLCVHLGPYLGDSIREEGRG
jgi:hypothetical protein